MASFFESVKNFFAPTSSISSDEKQRIVANDALNVFRSSLASSKDKEFVNEMMMKLHSIPELSVFGALDNSFNLIKAMSADTPDAKLASIYSKLKSLRMSCQARYADYAKMLGDGVTRAAVKLVVDDATQFDPVREMIVWVESPNKEWEKEQNEFLKIQVQMDKKVKQLAFLSAAYGDCYLNTFLNDDKYKEQNIIGRYFQVEDPLNLVELQRYGKTVGFFKFQTANSMNVSGSANNYASKFKTGVFKSSLHSAGDYIHFSLNQGFMSEKIVVEGEDITGDMSEEEYDTVTGESMLEAARSDFALRQFYDFLLLLARYNKSTRYTLFGVEVGDSSDRQAEHYLENFKREIATRQSYDALAPYLNLSNAPLQTGGNIYYTTRNGKGVISVQEVNHNDQNVNMNDVNYFDDRYFGSLGVPKQFLGQAKELPGGLGDSTMTRLDIKYGRTVKTVQMAVKNGVSDLVIWKSKNIDHKLPPEFVVKMVPVVTADEVEKDRINETELERTSKMLDLIDRFGLMDDPNFNKKEVLKHLINRLSTDTYLGDILFKKNSNPDIEQEQQ